MASLPEWQAVLPDDASSELDDAFGRLVRDVRQSVLERGIADGVPTPVHPRSGPSTSSSTPSSSFTSADHAFKIAYGLPLDASTSSLSSLPSTSASGSFLSHPSVPSTSSVHNMPEYMSPPSVTPATYTSYPSSTGSSSRIIPKTIGTSGHRVRLRNTAATLGTSDDVKRYVDSSFFTRNARSQALSTSSSSSSSTLPQDSVSLNDSQSDTASSLGSPNDSLGSSQRSDGSSLDSHDSTSSSFLSSHDQDDGDRDAVVTSCITLSAPSSTLSATLPSGTSISVKGPIVIASGDSGSTSSSSSSSTTKKHQPGKDSMAMKSSSADGSATSSSKIVFTKSPSTTSSSSSSSSSAPASSRSLVSSPLDQDDVSSLRRDLQTANVRIKSLEMQLTRSQERAVTAERETERVMQELHGELIKAVEHANDLETEKHERELAGLPSIGDVTLLMNELRRQLGEKDTKMNELEAEVNRLSMALEDEQNKYSYMYTTAVNKANASRQDETGDIKERLESAHKREIQMMSDAHATEVIRLKEDVKKAEEQLEKREKWWEDHVNERVRQTSMTLQTDKEELSRREQLMLKSAQQEREHLEERVKQLKVECDNLREDVKRECEEKRDALMRAKELEMASTRWRVREDEAETMITRMSNEIKVLEEKRKMMHEQHTQQMIQFERERAQEREASESRLKSVIEANEMEKKSMKEAHQAELIAKEEAERNGVNVWRRTKEEVERRELNKRREERELWRRERDNLLAQKEREHLAAMQERQDRVMELERVCRDLRTQCEDIRRDANKRIVEREAQCHEMRVKLDVAETKVQAMVEKMRRLEGVVQVKTAEAQQAEDERRKAEARMIAQHEELKNAYREQSSGGRKEREGLEREFREREALLLREAERREERAERAASMREAELRQRLGELTEQLAKERAQANAVKEQSVMAVKTEMDVLLKEKMILEEKLRVEGKKRMEAANAFEVAERALNSEIDNLRLALMRQESMVESEKQRAEEKYRGELSVMEAKLADHLSTISGLRDLVGTVETKLNKVTEEKQAALRQVERTQLENEREIARLHKEHDTALDKMQRQFQSDLTRIQNEAASAARLAATEAKNREQHVEDKLRECELKLSRSERTNEQLQHEMRRERAVYEALSHEHEEVKAGKEDLLKRCLADEAKISDLEMKMRELEQASELAIRQARLEVSRVEDDRVAVAERLAETDREKTDEVKALQQQIVTLRKEKMTAIAEVESKVKDEVTRLVKSHRKEMKAKDNALSDLKAQLEVVMAEKANAETQLLARMKEMEAKNEEGRQALRKTLAELRGKYRAILLRRSVSGKRHGGDGEQDDSFDSTYTRSGHDDGDDGDGGNNKPSSDDDDEDDGDNGRSSSHHRLHRRRGYGRRTHRRLHPRSSGYASDDTNDRYYRHDHHHSSSTSSSSSTAHGSNLGLGRAPRRPAPLPHDISSRGYAEDQPYPSIEDAEMVAALKVRVESLEELLQGAKLNRDSTVMALQQRVEEVEAELHEERETGSRTISTLTERLGGMSAKITELLTQNRLLQQQLQSLTTQHVSFTSSSSSDSSSSSSSTPSSSSQSSNDSAASLSSDNVNWLRERLNKTANRAAEAESKIASLIVEMGRLQNAYKQREADMKDEHSRMMSSAMKHAEEEREAAVTREAEVLARLEKKMQEEMRRAIAVAVDERDRIRQRCEELEDIVDRLKNEWDEERVTLEKEHGEAMMQLKVSLTQQYEERMKDLERKAKKNASADVAVEWKQREQALRLEYAQKIHKLSVEHDRLLSESVTAAKESAVEATKREMAAGEAERKAAFEREMRARFELDMTNTRHELSVVRQERDATKIDVASLKGDVTKLMHEVVRLEGEVEKARRETAPLSEEIVNARRSAGEAIKSVEQREQGLMAKYEQTVEQLEKERTALNHRIRIMLDREAELSRELARLEDELQTKQAMETKMNHKLTGLTETLEEAQSRLGEVVSERDQLRVKVATIKNEYEAEIERLREAVGKSGVAKLEGQKVGLAQALSERARELADRERAVDELKDQVRSLTAELTLEREKRERIEREERRLTNTLKSLEEQRVSESAHAHDTQTQLNRRITKLEESVRLAETRAHDEQMARDKIERTMRIAIGEAEERSKEAVVEAEAKKREAEARAEAAARRVAEMQIIIDTVRHREGELEDSEREAMLLRARVEAQDKDAEQRKFELQQMAALVRNEREKSSELKEELDTQRAIVERQIAALHSVRQAAQRDLEGANTKTQEYEQRWRESESRCGKLTNELRKGHEKVHLLEADIAMLQAKVDDTKAEEEDRLAQLYNERATLQLELQTARADIRTLSADLLTAKMHVDDAMLRANEQSKRISDAEDDLAALSEERVMLARECNELKRALADKTRAVEVLEEGHKDALSSLQGKANRILALEGEKRALSSEVDALKSTLERVRALHAEELGHAEANLAKNANERDMILAKRKEEINNLRNAFQEERSELQNRITTLERLLNERQSQISEAERVITQLRTDMRGITTSAAETQRRLETRLLDLEEENKTAVMRLQKEMGDVKEDYETALRDAARRSQEASTKAALAVESANSRAEEAIVAANQRIEEANNKVKSLNERVEALQGDIRDLKTKMSHQSSEHAKEMDQAELATVLKLDELSKRKSDELKRETSKRDIIIRERESALAVSATKCKELGDRVLEMSHALHDRETEVTSLRERLGVAISRVGELEQQVAVVGVDNAQAQETIAVGERKIKVVEEDRQALESEISRLRDELNKCRTKLRDVTQKYEVNEEKVGDLTTDKVRLSEQVSNLKERVDAIESERRVLEGRLAECKEKVMNLTDQLQATQSKEAEAVLEWKRCDVDRNKAKEQTTQAIERADKAEAEARMLGERVALLSNSLSEKVALVMRMENEHSAALSKLRREMEDLSNTWRDRMHVVEEQKTKREGEHMKELERVRRSVIAEMEDEMRQMKELHSAALSGVSDRGDEITKGLMAVVADRDALVASLNEDCRKLKGDKEALHHQIEELERRLKDRGVMVDEAVNRAEMTEAKLRVMESERERERQRMVNEAMESAARSTLAAQIQSDQLGSLTVRNGELLRALTQCRYQRDQCALALKASQRLVAVLTNSSHRLKALVEQLVVAATTNDPAPFATSMDRLTAIMAYIEERTKVLDPLKHSSSGTSNDQHSLEDDSATDATKTSAGKESPISSDETMTNKADLKEEVSRMRLEKQAAKRRAQEASEWVSEATAEHKRIVEGYTATVAMLRDEISRLTGLSDRARIPYDGETETPRILVSTGSAGELKVDVSTPRRLQTPSQRATPSASHGTLISFTSPLSPSSATLTPRRVIDTSLSTSSISAVTTPHGSTTPRRRTVSQATALRNEALGLHPLTSPKNISDALIASRHSTPTASTQSTTLSTTRVVTGQSSSVIAVGDTSVSISQRPQEGVLVEVLPPSQPTGEDTLSPLEQRRRMNKHIMSPGHLEPTPTGPISPRGASGSVNVPVSYTAAPPTVTPLPGRNKTDDILDASFDNSFGGAGVTSPIPRRGRSTSTTRDDYAARSRSRSTSQTRERSKSPAINRNTGTIPQATPFYAGSTALAAYRHARSSSRGGAGELDVHGVDVVKQMTSPGSSSRTTSPISARLTVPSLSVTLAPPSTHPTNVMTTTTTAPRSGDTVNVHAFITSPSNTVDVQGRLPDGSTVLLHRDVFTPTHPESQSFSPSLSLSQSQPQSRFPSYRRSDDTQRDEGKLASSQQGLGMSSSISRNLSDTFGDAEVSPSSYAGDAISGATTEEERLGEGDAHGNTGGDNDGNDEFGHSLTGTLNFSLNNQSVLNTVLEASDESRTSSNNNHSHISSNRSRDVPAAGHQGDGDDNNARPSNDAMSSQNISASTIGRQTTSGDVSDVDVNNISALSGAGESGPTVSLPPLPPIRIHESQVERQDEGSPATTSAATGPTTGVASQQDHLVTPRMAPPIRTVPATAPPISRTISAMPSTRPSYATVRLEDQPTSSMSASSSSSSSSTTELDDSARLLAEVDAAVMRSSRILAETNSVFNSYRQDTSASRRLTTGPQTYTISSTTPTSSTRLALAPAPVPPPTPRRAHGPDLGFSVVPTPTPSSPSTVRISAPQGNVVVTTRGADVRITGPSTSPSVSRPTSATITRPIVPTVPSHIVSRPLPSSSTQQQQQNQASQASLIPHGPSEAFVRANAAVSDVDSVWEGVAQTRHGRGGQGRGSRRDTSSERGRGVGQSQSRSRSRSTSVSKRI